MNKKISHSAWTKYMTCPKLYDFHYNERLRPSKTSSALVFGTAVDAALNDLLITKDLDKAVNIFRDNFKYENMSNIEFDYKDLDSRLLDSSEIVADRNLVSWKCLRIKGRLFMEEYYNAILPLVEGVESVQKQLHNRPGFYDAIIKLRGYGRVLIDHKTSSKPYHPDAVKTDTQLALYASDLGIAKAGFIVLVKEIDLQTKRICALCGADGSTTKHKTCANTIKSKRCHGTFNETYRPKAHIQLLVDEIPEINKTLVNESICQTESAINSGIYPRNLKACGKMYGKPCPYINKCWSNNETGLIIEPSEDK